jgi:hypothetical protein
MFDQLTLSELDQLSDKLHRGAMHFLDEATRICCTLTQMPIWAPGYNDLYAQSIGSMGAGSEISQVFSEVSRTLRTRMAA